MAAQLDAVLAVVALWFNVLQNYLLLLSDRSWVKFVLKYQQHANNNYNESHNIIRPLAKIICTTVESF